MTEIERITVDRAENVITDSENPLISFALRSDSSAVELESAEITVGNWRKTVAEQTDIMYDGEPLLPFSKYTVNITAQSNNGDVAKKSADFYTGRLNLPWTAKWIGDKKYAVKKGESPVPVTMRKRFFAKKSVTRAYIAATAIGIYELELNGKRITDGFFSPGFTSYKNDLQYEVFDVTELVEEENEITAIIGGGWAVGRFTYESKSGITAKRPSFLYELFVEYADGTKEVVLSDKTWEITYDGNYRFCDFYDGETFDATVSYKDALWKFADEIELPFSPKISARYGEKVCAREVFSPQKVFASPSGKTIYDFGQNFAGVVRLTFNGKKGRVITIRHAEALEKREIFVKSLRTAKATVKYICKDGLQTYMPKMTYMGFRYAEIDGVSPKGVLVEGVAVYSDLSVTGDFECSDKRLNKLHKNAVWSGKSNFVDIPTDCPQRDERQGWTGDIAIFANTACYNFDMRRFLEKWLKDLVSEQSRLGGIPLVVPKHGNTAPSVPTACWGDSVIIVPWELYKNYGDKAILEKTYPAMLSYMRSVKFFSSLSGLGKRRFIWKLPFQFGDWCAPEGYVKDWMARGKWIATAYYANSCRIMSEISKILGKEKESKYFSDLFEKICDAYESLFADGNGKLNCEFQSAYVLPLAFGMISGEKKRKMTDNLVKLLEKTDRHISTGFPSTSKILFALSDGGREDEAYKLLLTDTCPSWLYEVKCGATTFWERWDSMNPDGTLKLKSPVSPEDAGMGSLNHYAYGAVCEFLYRRVLGLEPTSLGYKTFSVSPVVGGGLTYAKGSHVCPYGRIEVSWKINGGVFTVEVSVPVSCSCEVTMQSGKKYIVKSGKHAFSETYNGGSK